MITMTESERRTINIKWFREHLPEETVKMCEKVAKKYCSPDCGLSYSEVLEAALKEAYTAI